MHPLMEIFASLSLSLPLNTTSSLVLVSRDEPSLFEAVAHLLGTRLVFDEKFCRRLLRIPFSHSYSWCSLFLFFRNSIRSRGRTGMKREENAFLRKSSVFDSLLGTSLRENPYSLGIPFRTEFFSWTHSFPEEGSVRLLREQSQSSRGWLSSCHLHAKGCMRQLLQLIFHVLSKDVYENKREGSLWRLWKTNSSSRTLSVAPFLTLSLSLSEGEEGRSDASDTESKDAPGWESKAQDSFLPSESQDNWGEVCEWLKYSTE